MRHSLLAAALNSLAAQALAEKDRAMTNPAEQPASSEAVAAQLEYCLSESRRLVPQAYNDTPCSRLNNDLGNLIDEWSKVPDLLRQESAARIAALEAENAELTEEYEEAERLCVTKEFETLVELRQQLKSAEAERDALRKNDARYRLLCKVTPYRFKKIQDVALTDGDGVTYFHQDRFDKALAAQTGERKDGE